MKHFVLTLAIIGLTSLPAWSVEDLTLTTPITRANTATWRLDEVHISRSAPSVSTVFLDPVTGTRVTCTETGAAATALITALNTANLTANSLFKRAMTRAQTTACLGAGSVAGTPD